MMRRPVATLAFLLLVSPCSAFVAPTGRVRVGHAFSRVQPSLSTRNVVNSAPLVPTGRKSSSLEMLGLPACETLLAPKNLALAFGVLVGGLGVSQLLNPVDSMERRGYTIKEGTVAEYFSEWTGFANMGTAVTAFLAATGKVAVQKAIGYGVITRLLFSLYAQMKDMNEKVGRHWQISKVMIPVLAACSLSCVTGKVDPTLAAKIVSVLPAAVATALYFNTEPIARRTFSKYSSEHTLGNAVEFSVKTFASAVLSSSILMAPMAFGVDAITSIGYAALARAVKLGLIDRYFVAYNMQKPYTTTEKVATALNAIIAVGILQTP